MTYADLMVVARSLGLAAMDRRDQKVATTESAVNHGQASRDAFLKGASVNVKQDGTVEMFVKHDDGKARFDLLQPLALTEVAKVLEHGSKKYADNNWRKGAAWSRYYGALQRHLNAWWAGESLDKDSGLGHLAHAACCLMFLQSYEIEKLGTDDRPCCCGVPNDTQAKHSVDACVGPDAAVGRMPTLRTIEELRASLETKLPPQLAHPTAVEVQARMAAAQERIREFYRIPAVRIERVSNDEGREATAPNRRLLPEKTDDLIFNGYRYQNAVGRVAYIVALKRAGTTRVAIGSAVLQPGDTEDRKIGLQIAVGQALKNFNRERFYGRSPYVMHLATRFSRMPEHVANAYQTMLPPIAEQEIERADARKQRTPLQRYFDDMLSRR